MSALLISLSVTISNRLSALIVISAISLAISAPSLIAIPTSAAERAGESFMLVADHYYLMALCFHFINKSCFIFRKHL